MKNLWKHLHVFGFSHTLSGVPFKIESILIKATIILIGAVAYTTIYRISVGIRLRYSYRFSPDSIFQYDLDEWII